MHAVLLVLILSQNQPLPPPPPPPQDPAPQQLQPAPLPQVRDENGVAMIAEHPSRVRVSLTAEASGAELYDVSALMYLCRAPCGIWINTDETRKYRVRAAGVTESSEFALNEFSGDVAIHFTHRNDVARGLGLASTIVGAVGVIGGAAVALAWLIVIGIINLFVALFRGPAVIGGFEFLYAAAIAAGVGGAFLTPGLILLLGIGREKLDLRQGPPPDFAPTPAPAPATP